MPATAHETTGIRSLAEVRAWFDARGMTVTDWACRHGFRRESVYAVLSGHSRFRRGEAHQIAVALRLKVGASDESGWEGRAGGGSPDSEGMQQALIEESAMT
jgi:gp16 family phage-associated protein